MKRICPTVQELLAFDAVARCESVTQAASELCMSVSGVSKQVSGLEDFVGRPLLKKLGRGVQLTAVGREYWKKISPGLRMIESATTEARGNECTSGLLVLASVPTFLSKWLIPRLPDFRRFRPDVTFVFKQHIDLDSDFPADVDAVISHGLGYWPDVKADYIAGKEFVCIYSPELLKKRRGINYPKDLLTYTLLHLENSPLAWRKWGYDYGISEEETRDGPRFTQYSAVIQAALSGLGIGLVPRILVNNELQDGRLLSFWSFSYEDQGHYLYVRTDKPERPVLTTFLSWLREQKENESSD